MEPNHSWLGGEEKEEGEGRGGLARLLWWLLRFPHIITVHATHTSKEMLST